MLDEKENKFSFCSSPTMSESSVRLGFWSCVRASVPEELIFLKKNQKNGRQLEKRRASSSFYSFPTFYESSVII